MRILEEYIKRNKIENAPIVQHTHNSFFILRPKIISDISDYTIINIKWHEKSKGPGNYTVQLSELKKYITDWSLLVNSTSYLERNFIFNYKTIQTIEYDDYENYIFDVFEKLNIEKKNLFSPSNYKEAFFTLWEAFVCVFDSYFKEQDLYIKNLLWESLNTENSEDVRISNIDSILQDLNANFYSLYFVWNIDMLTMLTKYAVWMHNLHENIK